MYNFHIQCKLLPISSMITQFKLSKIQQYFLMSFANPNAAPYKHISSIYAAMTIIFIDQLLLSYAQLQIDRWNRGEMVGTVGRTPTCMYGVQYLWDKPGKQSASHNNNFQSQMTADKTIYHCVYGGQRTGLERYRNGARAGTVEGTGALYVCTICIVCLMSSGFATHELNFCHLKGVAGCLNQCLSASLSLCLSVSVALPGMLSFNFLLKKENKKIPFYKLPCECSWNCRMCWCITSKLCAHYAHSHTQHTHTTYTSIYILLQTPQNAPSPEISDDISIISRAYLILSLNACLHLIWASA